MKEIYEEDGTDQDFDRYAVEVMNGDGHYNSVGKFIRYNDPDAWWNTEEKKIRYSDPDAWWN